MKAIKFVILGVGVLSLIAFFMPYAKVQGTTYSALEVIQGIELTQKAVRAIGDAATEDLADEAQVEARAETKETFKELDDALDLVKTIIIVCFLPTWLFIVIGGVGALRGKLERLGGTGVMLLGFLSLAINGFFLALWGSAEMKAEGGDAGLGQYLLVMCGVAGFVLGLLTLIKPDRGGKFG